jgi:hypothetical protein
LTAVALTTQTDTGTERLVLALAPEAVPTRVIAQTDTTPKESDTKRLEEQLRALAADRDRLVARIASLEHNFEDMTGSIKRQIAMAPAAAPTLAPISPPSQLPILSAPATTASPTLSPLAMPAATDSAPSWPQAARADAEPEPKAEPKPDTRAQSQIEEKPLPPPVLHSVPMPPVRVASATPTGEPAAETPRKAEIGVDLGGAQSMDVLNARWAAVKANFGPQLGGLHARAANDRRPGAIPYRLLVGPLPNGAAAAALCAHFAAARVTCRTVKFVGNEMAQR